MPDESRLESKAEENQQPLRTPGLGSSVPEALEKGKNTGYPLQYSGLENSMDRGAWEVTVHGVTKNRTRLRDFHYVHGSTINNSPGEGNGTPLQYSCLENPWMEEPGRLQSMGSLRVRPD